ncbi:hypothetical protein LTR16_005269, partial [Cryomyces antarcticus]
MPHKSPFQLDIPATDVLTWLFPPGSTPSDKPIWIDAVKPEENHLSPRELLQWVKRLGVGLDKLGLKQNEAVMMHSANHIFVPVAYLGVAGSGRVFSGCNPAYTVSEVAFQIENTGAKAILVDPTLLEVMLAAADKLKFPRNRIFLFSDHERQPVDGVQDWRTMLGSSQEAERWQWHSMSRKESQTRTA